MEILQAFLPLLTFTSLTVLHSSILSFFQPVRLVKVRMSEYRDWRLTDTLQVRLIPEAPDLFSTPHSTAHLRDITVPFNVPENIFEFPRFQHSIKHFIQAIICLPWKRLCM